MRPRKPDPTPQTDMFRQSLAEIPDRRHKFLRLACRIDRDRLDALYGATFVDHVGRYRIANRSDGGAASSQAYEGLSDQAVCAA
jgi:hypothetical protein